MALIGVRRALLVRKKLPTAAVVSGVTIDATGVKKFKSSSTSFSDATVITVGSGNALIVTIAFGYVVTPPSSVTCTWSGASMTKLASIDNSGGTAFDSVYIFGIRNPAAGANTLALSWSNAAEIFVDAISFSGVNVTSDGTAFPHTATQDSGIGLTVAVTSAVGNYVVASEAPNSGSTTLTGTTLFFDNSSGALINAGANYDNGAASVNIGAATGNNAMIIAAVDVAF